MRALNIFLFTFLLFGFLFSQEQIPVENVEGVGELNIYKSGKVFKYKIFETIKKREKKVKTYILLESVKDAENHYKNLTVLNADFQNLKLGSILIALSKVSNLNVIFGKDLWKSVNVEEENESEKGKEENYTLQLQTLKKNEVKRYKESEKSSEKLSLPSYLFQDVSFVINSPVGIFTLFNTLLDEYNLIAIPYGNIIKITRKEKLLIDVRNIGEKNTRKVIAKIRTYTSKAGKIIYDKDLKKIIVIDSSENVKTIKEIYPRLIRSFEVKTRTSKVKKREKETKVLYFPNKRNLEIAVKRIKDILGRRIFLNVDRDFNALIIHGKVKDVGFVEKLVSDLTGKVSTSYLTTKVFYVRYMSPEELKKKIQPMLSEEGEVYILNVGNSEKGSEKVKATGVAPKEVFKEELNESREFFVTLGNAILIKDYPERIEKIREKFKKFLSEKPIKIRIRAKLVEVEKSLLRELGISWRTVFSKAYIPEFWSGETAFRTVTPGQPQSGLLTFTFQRNRLNLLEFQLLAYEQKGRAKNIAETYVITVNGEPAVIASGLEYPVTKVTLSGGVAKVEPKYESIPIVLVTTPVVLPDGNILLSVYLARRQINSIQEFPVTQTLTQKIPIFSTSRIDVKITVKNGDTVVIGGAIEKNNNTTETGVPGLRKVPLLGWLFKTQTKQMRDRELLIFITPEIVEED